MVSELKCKSELSCYCWLFTWTHLLLFRCFHLHPPVFSTKRLTINLCRSRITAISRATSQLCCATYKLREIMFGQYLCRRAYTIRRNGKFYIVGVLWFNRTEWQKREKSSQEYVCDDHDVVIPGRSGYYIISQDILTLIRSLNKPSTCAVSLLCRDSDETE